MNNSTPENRQIGGTQLALLAEAASRTSGQLMVEHTDNARWCAMKRMVKRGLFVRHLFGADSIYGRTVIYEITTEGRAKLQRYS